MKRFLSLFLALIMLLSIGVSSGTFAYSASKTYAEDALEEIQTTTGFIPGKTAAVTYNCYGFIAAVCEKLFGVSYNGEGLYENYKAKHSTGNFYTVATYTTPNYSPTSTDVEDIISFFTKYAAPGDVVHYGAFNKSVSKTHTVMIQSISNEKISFFHSNYQVAQNSRESCHIDSIYWDSFRKNPTQSIKNSDGTLYSLNAMFYATMKAGGIGITINRYSKYEDKFYLVGAAVPSIKTMRSSTTGITVSWDEIIGATKYRVQYKKSSDTSYITATSDCTALKYTIDNLSVGTMYDFRVCACVGEKWMKYSDVSAKKVLPPTVSVIIFTPKSDGLQLYWSKRNDITGVRIYKSTSASSGFSKIKTITDNSVSTYIDSSISYGKTYYYKIERYVKVSSSEYSTTSSAISGSYTLNKPDITYTNNSATSITFNLKENGTNDYFKYYVTDSDSKNYIPVTKTTDKSITLSGLKAGEKYTFNCSQATYYGSSDYQSVTVQALPKKEQVKSVKATAKGVHVSFSNSNDVSGYAIYRSLEQNKNYSFVGRVEGSNVSSYTDSTVEYNTTYYYKVRSYVSAGSTKYYSAYSKPSEAVKISLAKPQNLKVSIISPSSVTLTWSAVTNANKYLVQFKSEDGSWKDTKVTSSLSKTIINLGLGKVYQYRVKAINDIGSSAYCTAISKKMLPPTPAAPTLKVVSNKGIRISWKAEEWATGYKIYRSESKSGTYTLIKTVTNPKTYVYTDTTVKKNKTYYYKTVSYVTKKTTTYNSAKSPAAGIQYA